MMPCISVVYTRNEDTLNTLSLLQEKANGFNNNGCNFQKKGKSAKETERINKHKITDNEVNSFKYLMMKFMYLFKHI